jgi:nitrogen fixation/metabolism regulation signal transduction histidine kinase
MMILKKLWLNTTKENAFFCRHTGCGGIMMAICIAISTVTANLITKPLVGITKRLEDLSNGDLHSDVPQINTNDDWKHWHRQPIVPSVI